MPNAFPDIIAARTRTGFSSTLSSELDPCILLKTPDTLREETCSYEIEKACGHHKEDLQRGLVAAFVDQIADQSACTQATNDSKRKTCCWSAETYTSDEPGF